MPRSPKAESSRVAAALAEWRGAHPAAMLLEIEEAVDRFLRDERAALIAETA